MSVRLQPFNTRCSLQRFFVWDLNEYMRVYGRYIFGAGRHGWSYRDDSG